MSDVPWDVYAMQQEPVMGTWGYDLFGRVHYNIQASLVTSLIVMSAEQLIAGAYVTDLGQSCILCVVCRLQAASCKYSSCCLVPGSYTAVRLVCQKWAIWLT